MLMAGVSFPALAQQTPPASQPEATLPEIQVTVRQAPEVPTGPVRGYVAKRTITATKTDTPLIETPQSISVITRDQMNAQNVQSVSDALRYSAGVLAESNGPDPRADYPTIRGFSAGGRSSYRDGLRDYAFNGQGGVVIEPHGLERIEVLRGPSSVLYGQSDAGGTVNLVSKRPTKAPLREVQLQIGSHDRKQVAIDLGGVIGATSDWSYRLTGLVRDADTQIDHVIDDRVFIAPALTWQPSAATSLTLLTSYQKNERGQGYQALPMEGTLIPGPGGARIPTNRFVGEPGFDRFNQERSSIGYAFEHEFNEQWAFRQNLRSTNQNTNSISIYQAGLTSPTTVDRYIGPGRERVKNFLLDNQLQWKSRTQGLEQTVLLGLDHQRMRNVSGTSFGVAPPLDVYNPVYGQPLPLSGATPPDEDRNTLTQTGLYVQDQLKFNDRISWTIGGRYDKTRTNSITLATGDEAPQRDHAFTWRTGAVYLFDSGWAPYVGYAKSFLPVAGNDAFKRPFKPETGEQIEAGIRYQPKNRDVSFLASVYELRRQNVLTNDLENFGESIQRGEIRSRGLELEAKASVTRTVDLVANYAYNDLVVTRSNGDDLGKTPNTSPKNIVSVWATWQIPAVSSLKVSAGVRHIGASFGDEQEALRVPSYTLVDAALEFDLARVLQTSGEWRLALNVSNLLDRTYVATCGYYADGCKYGYRRHGALTLTHRW